MEGMVDPLTIKTKKPKSENLKVVISNSDGQSDIDEGEDYSSKEESERSRNELLDAFDDGHEDERTGRNRKGRHQRIGKDFNNSERSSKSKAESNSISGRNKKPDTEVSDEAQEQTSEEYSSEDYKRQHEDRRPLGKEVKNLRGRRGRPSNKRHSFEEDMYQDRDDTSDERKDRILRGRGRAKRYAEDDVSMEEDSDDDVTPRRTIKPKQNGYRRARSPKDRAGRRRDRDVGYSEEYSDTTRDGRNSYRNNRYGGRRNYKNDGEPGYNRKQR